MPTPDWTQVQHQYGKYELGVMASYPPSGVAVPGGPALPALATQPAQTPALR